MAQIARTEFVNADNVIEWMQQNQAHGNHKQIQHNEIEPKPLGQSILSDADHLELGNFFTNGAANLNIPPTSLAFQFDNKQPSLETGAFGYQFLAAPPPELLGSEIFIAMPEQYSNGFVYPSQATSLIYQQAGQPSAMPVMTSTFSPASTLLQAQTMFPGLNITTAPDGSNIPALNNSHYSSADSSASHSPMTPDNGHTQYTPTQGQIYHQAIINSTIAAAPNPRPTWQFGTDNSFNGSEYHGAAVNEYYDRGNRVIDGNLRNFQAEQLGGNTLKAPEEPSMHQEYLADQSSLGQPHGDRTASGDEDSGSEYHMNDGTVEMEQTLHSRGAPKLGNKKAATGKYAARSSKVNKKERLTDEQKRHNHIVSESIRREKIKEAFTSLVKVIPGCEEAKTTKGHAISAAASYMKRLQEDNGALRALIAAREAELANQAELDIGHIETETNSTSTSAFITT
jgi:hypothetical protein